MYKKYLLTALLLLALPVYAEDEPDHEIHEELRAVLTTVQNAINSEKYDDMLPVISENIRATTITQEVMSNHAEVSNYFKRWFGPGGFLRKLHMNLKADALTELSADRTWGLVRGAGSELYTLSDGREYDMKTRWTAVVQKDPDSKWRLRSIHIGTDFLDNPILTEAKNAAIKAGVAGAGGGLLAGVLAGFFLGRRRKQ
jgi:ketosteroid isomerase-like protein